MVTALSLFCAFSLTHTNIFIYALFFFQWGPIINDGNGTKVWSWDKRTYLKGQYGAGPRLLEKIPMPPKWDPSRGYKLQVASARRSLPERQIGLERLCLGTFNFEGGCVSMSRMALWSQRVS